MCTTHMAAQIGAWSMCDGEAIQLSENPLIDSILGIGIRFYL